MEKLFDKLKEYLKMETEISLDEFTKYYQEVLSFNQENFDNLNQEDSIKGRYIMSILAINSGERGKRKDKDAKKYKKIWEKAQFWTDAYNYRLLKMGMTQEEIDASHEQFNEDI